MRVRFTNDIGMVKETKVGFSWTMLFFGCFVPLFRADWIQFIISLVLAFITMGISWLVYPFIYNKLYINGLLQHGWYPASEPDRGILIQKGFMVNKSAETNVATTEE